MSHAIVIRVSVHLAALLVAGTVAAASCGSDGVEDTTPPTTTIVSATTRTTGTPPPTTAATTSTSTTTITSSVTTSTPLPAPPLAIDPAWVAYDDLFGVWGVAADDVLNVRTGPGVSNPIIGEFGPTARDVHRFDVTEFVRDQRWGVVRFGQGAGWVNLAFLRPVGTTPPITIGSVDASIAGAADRVRELLGSGDVATLSEHVDPDRGLTVSVHASITETTPVLSLAQVAGSATDSATLLWGYTDGDGAPIVETIRQRLRAVAGDTGLTSTDAIGYDVRLGFGNSIDNIDHWFPGSSVVEYHFDGTSLYGDFDWSSVRFVFDAEAETPSGRPVLLAIVQDTWTI
ncbi:MAG: hypothetical protein R2733_01225 [Acidimicrobiales bacterium]